MAVLQNETLFTCSVEGLFDFMGQPANLALVSRPELGIAFTSALEMVAQGSRLEFQVVTFGQVVKAAHQIVEFEYPRLVTERQIAGPLKSWTHRHEYESRPQGVLKRDIIEFELPGGLIGLMLSEATVKDHLENGLYYRDQKLNELIQQGRIA